MKTCCSTLLVGLLLAVCLSALAEDAKYDPLLVPGAKLPEPVDLIMTDAKRNRDIPIRVYLPAEKSPAAVVLFSHGLGGSREGSPFLGKHWAARGYVAVFLQHPGSDTAVWKDQPMQGRLAAMQKEANLENSLLRFKDVPAVLDDLQRRNETKDDPLFGRLDLKHIGMSGHSFGAVTTQAVSGQTAAGRVSFTDPRIKAAIIMSPSTPKVGDPQAAFGSVKIPWLLMTGTKDLSIIGGADMKSRLGVYPTLPAGGKYELVMHNAQHSAFTERALPLDILPRNPNHHKAILALSTAFWDAYLKDNAAAKAWLDGDGAKSVLEKEDQWQRK